MKCYLTLTQSVDVVTNTVRTFTKKKKEVQRPVHWQYSCNRYTVIPRPTSDPANEFFGQRRFFRFFFWTRLTNVLVDARANIKK